MKNPHPQNTAKWWLFDKIESRKALIASRLDDIQRAERSVAECREEIAVMETELRVLTEAEQ